ncbi:MAG: 30S ribosomal protein S16 [Betaproteobacteria bacterium]|nr:30S ribosomal protein S16 [Betaproteobacteria bacterium]
MCGGPGRRWPWCSRPRGCRSRQWRRHRRDGRFIERIGFYNPIAAGGEEGLRISQDRLNYWTGVGAQTSPTVDRLIKQAGKKAA